VRWVKVKAIRGETDMKKINQTISVFTTVSLAFLAGCQSANRSDQTASASSATQLAPVNAPLFERAKVQLQSRSKSKVQGEVMMMADGENTVIRYDVLGLKPNSMHGMHIHQIGDCSAPDATSAGDHFNPSGKPHGGPGTTERHVGDLGNLQADAKGRAQGEMRVPGLVMSGAQTFIGRSLVVHANPDDLKSQPSGNSGPRIACGIIGAL